MAKKVLWSGLSARTKNRYKSHGITPQMYNSPRRRKENADLFKAAQGKAPKSYAAQRAEQLGIVEVFPGYAQLPKTQQQFLADEYRTGFFTKNAGIIPGGSPGKDFAFGTEYHPETDKWYSLDSTVATRMDFLRFLDEHGHDFDAEDWKTYREKYREHF